MLSSSNEQMERKNAEEISRSMHDLKPKTSAGFGEISNFMIKRLPPTHFECLAIVLTAVVKQMQISR
jgi:hypothetical protein